MSQKIARERHHHEDIDLFIFSSCLDLSTSDCRELVQCWESRERDERTCLFSALETVQE